MSKSVAAELAALLRYRDTVDHALAIDEKMNREAEKALRRASDARGPGRKITKRAKR